MRQLNLLNNKTLIVVPQKKQALNRKFAFLLAFKIWILKDHYKLVFLSLIIKRQTNNKIFKMEKAVPQIKKK